MPTYQYACTSADCGNEFEVVQSFTDAAVTDCPQCDERVRKVYGSVGVVFKGSGFYRTDSRDSSSASAAAKKPESKSESKSDSSASSSASSSSGSSSGSTSSTASTSSSSSSSPATTAS